MVEYKEILQYWFGGDQNLNYKIKWFPSVSAGQQATTDTEIFEKFSHIFNEALSNKLTTWKEQCIHCNLAHIVLLDQFSRHIFRYKKLDDDNPLRVQADLLAIESTEALIGRTNWLEQLSSTEIVFALMPYRHTPTLVRLRYVLEMLDLKQNLETKALELMNKFRKQTILRLQRMEDRNKVSSMNLNN